MEGGEGGDTSMHGSPTGAYHELDSVLHDTTIFGSEYRRSSLKMLETAVCSAAVNR